VRPGLPLFTRHPELDLRRSAEIVLHAHVAEAFTEFGRIPLRVALFLTATVIEREQPARGGTDLLVGYALGIGAIGAVAGSYLGGHVPKSWPFGRTIAIAYAVDGLLFVPVMVTHNFAVAIFFLTLTNACVLFEITQIIGWRIRVIPDDAIGRVSGAARLVALLGTVPGAIVGGALADRYGARLPIVISGVGYLIMASTVWASPALRREAR